MSALRRVKRLVHECKCERCGHTWVAFKLPKACANCKQTGWNVPKGVLPLGRPKVKK
jgi:predicted Zn-ribbon and HTH transcriptional regulator